MPPAAGGASPPPVPPTGKVPAPGTVLRFLHSKKLETVPGAGTLPVWGTGGRSAPGRRRQTPGYSGLTRMVPLRPWAARPSISAKASTIETSRLIAASVYFTMLERRKKLTVSRPLK